MLAAVLGGRVPLALGAAVAVLLGAALGDARLAATGPGRLPSLTGRQIAARGFLLEPLRERASGGAVARVRLAGAVDAAVLGRVAAAAAAPGGAPPGDCRGAARGTTALPRAAAAPGGIAAAVAGEIALVRVRAPAPVAVGAEVEVRGTVSALRPYEAYVQRRGAFAAVDAGALTPTGSRRGGLAGVLDAARERAARGLSTGLPPPEAALLRGMVLGQDEAIDKSVRDEFRTSGLAHLLAVSGQNVLLLCLLVLAGASLTGVPLRARLLAAAALVVLYVPLAGGGPSIQRAGVMGVAGLVAALAGRPASRWYALGLAAAVTLTLNPRAAGDPGWQLSFAAVAGLLALGPRLKESLARRMPDPVAEAIAVTVAATIATAPLLAFHFEQVSLVSLPANLAAAPVVAPIMWLGMLGIAAAQVAPGLVAPLNALCAPLLGYLEWIAHAAAGAPAASVPVRLGGPAALAASYAALAGAGWLVALVMRRVRTDTALGIGGGRLRALAAAAVLVVSLGGVAAHATRSRGAPVEQGELVVSFLDIGQGDATLLQTRDTAVLFDTGPPGGPILRRLGEAGVRRLDLLVLTHAEADHEGMALPVIARHRPRLVLDGGAGWPSPVQPQLPRAVRAASGRVLVPRAGQRIRVGPLAIEILWPPPPPPGWRPEGTPNDRAVVARVRDGDFDLLLPADAESNVTAALDLPPVDALKLAHHGSADEGLPRLLERLDPSVAAIEVGARNTYGHPTPSTLGALRGVPHVVRTDLDGTVRLHVTANGAMRLQRHAG